MNNLQKEEVNKARDAEIEKLFSEIPYESDIIVDLPSKGRFYKDFNGLKITPLLFEDEQKILMSKNKNINPINEIISKCIDGVDVNDLLDVDKLYVLLKIKEISYGPDYKFDIMCPACGANGNSILPIKDIPVNFIPEDVSDPREVLLPVLKAKVKIRFLRTYDEKYFMKPEDFLSNLYRLVVSINDNKDPVFIAKVLKKLHIRDIKTIRNEINSKSYGVDTTFRFECPSCGHNSIVNIPFDANFFSVS
jgi:predicted RNA-binding Zn-ribbon protein involved in translation (DUF1610 family)